MAIRYSDSIKQIEKSSEFVRRKYKPSLIRLIITFFVVLAIGITITALLLSPLHFVMVMTVLMGGLGTYVIVEIQRGRDLVVATEYQNAMYASALIAGNRFTVIVTREGSVVYLDGGLRAMYPDIGNERHLSLSSLLKFSKIAPMDREKMLDVVQRGGAEKMLLEMRLQDNRVQPMVISLRPIAKPSGFMLLQGRDFVEERNGNRSRPANMEAANPLLSKTSISMFANIMDRMGTGLYMIDMNGFVLYANPTLEGWLHFGQGEISGGQYSLRDLVLGVSAQDALHPGDFEGENSLLKKQGGTIKAYINQKIIYGDNQKQLGCVAIITNIVTGDPEQQKKLW